MRPQDKERIQVEVVSRVVERYIGRSAHAPAGYLETLVNDTLYHERLRLDKAPSDGPRVKEDRAFYRPMRKRFQHASSTELQRLLTELARHFVEEITGNFDERVYKFATSVLPTGLTMMLDAASPGRIFSLRALRGGLRDHLVLQGEIEHLQALSRKGTLVVVPTHSSNLDSPMFGYAWHLIGQEPLCYGAGLNLFTNPMMSFFMQNLGAYKVDRRKQAQLYKEMLKEYATVSMEMGYDNLFFPGGTRSRSGAVEGKLKKGLLGCAVRAYVGNLRAKKPRPNLYVIPCTLNYKLVLEAETLIEDHLKEVGKSRYIIEDDEFSKPRRIANWMRNMMSLDDRIVVTFGAPLDVFGNKVDRDGNSLDPRGRVIDAARYVMRDGEPQFDDQRDAQYTRETEQSILEGYRRGNVVQSTNLVSYAVWSLLQRGNPGMDLYRLLRTGGATPSFPMEQVHAETERVLEGLKQVKGGPTWGEELQGEDVQAIVADALKHYSIYHTHPAAVRRGDRLFHEDPNLLLYYGNRLHGYDLGRILSA